MFENLKIRPKIKEIRDNICFDNLVVKKQRLYNVSLQSGNYGRHVYFKYKDYEIDFHGIFDEFNIYLKSYSDWIYLYRKTKKITLFFREEMLLKQKVRKFLKKQNKLIIKEQSDLLKWRV